MKIIRPRSISFPTSMTVVYANNRPSTAPGRFSQPINTVLHAITTVSPLTLPEPTRSVGMSNGNGKTAKGRAELLERGRVRVQEASKRNQNCEVIHSFKSLNTK